MQTETPDQFLDRLEKMGEPRVRGLLDREYFEPRQGQVAQGWLDRRERAREGPPPEVADAGEALRQASEARATAEAAHALANRAIEDARKNERIALAAIAIGAFGVLVSIASLLVVTLS